MVDRVAMDQQSSGEDKPKISRATARHLRRKRLAALRKTTEHTLLPTQVNAEQNIPCLPTKSKARRLRKRNNAELLKGSSQTLKTETCIPNSNSQTESSFTNECSNGNLEQDKSGQNISQLQLNTARSSNRSSLQCSPTKDKSPDSGLRVASEATIKVQNALPTCYQNTNLNTISNIQHSRKLENARNSLSFDDLEIGEADFVKSVCQNNYQESKSPHQGTSSELHPRNDIKLRVSRGITNSKDSTECKTATEFDSAAISKQSEVTMNSTEKNREQIKAEREAKKAAKALAKVKGKAQKVEQKADPQCSVEPPAKAITSEGVQKQNQVTENVAAKSEGRKIVMTEKPLGIENKENDSQGRADGKSKREIREERRAQQEAQRAAKEKLLAEKTKAKLTAVPKTNALPKVSEPVKTIHRKILVENNLHEVKLFKHLYQERELAFVHVPILNSNIHPAIVRLGAQYANKVIIGSNARCVAFLAAVKQLIEDFERPSQADFTRGLEVSLQECAAYLHHCRPMAVSMQNALKHLKWQMTQLPSTVSDEDAKSKLRDAIDTYIREQIQLAGKAISNTIQTKISNGDVILTYAFSSLIHNILIDAHNGGKQFRVIVVDGRPWLEGKEQLRRLARHGIECSYILINALSFIMPEVSKVFLGAHAILANGAVMSRAGTAQVALMAKAFNVPVLVACETHKSCERVQTDSFVYNEIGDADELARNLLSNSKTSPLLNWKTKKSLDLLNITFDVTPADLVSAVVTELAILPCTSIPVILRIKPSEI